jgi:hypothetical protein
LRQRILSGIPIRNSLADLELRPRNRVVHITL